MADHFNEYANQCIENLNHNHSHSPIQNFYREGSVLITGATGFVGKALLEKLLRSLTGLKYIYILIRPKHDDSVEKRFNELVNNVIFEKLRKDRPSVLKKIVCIEGDITKKDLGLVEKHYKEITSNVTVVFHLAATVRFVERLHNAIKLNTIATQYVIQFCSNIHNLKAFVYVSTAYSNGKRNYVEETIYSPPADPDELMRLCLADPKKTNEMTDSLLGTKHPNTYTLTKAMAEWIVSHQADYCPTAAVRPSIVTAAWKEPMPGWVDNVSGITGIVMECGKGTIRSIMGNEKLTVDLIPVDFVVNSIIVAAWHVWKSRCDKVQVYNCTTGQTNSIQWKHLRMYSNKYGPEIPSKTAVWYPCVRFTTNRLVHFFFEIFFHFLPALLIDVYMNVSGGEAKMIKIFKKFRSARKTGEFFSLNEWNFRCENYLLLDSELPEEDRNMFFTDVKPIKWEEYFKSYMLGIRKFVLKDPLDTLPFARRKIRKYYWLSKLIQIFFLVVIFKILLTVFNC